jgi:hypothetical protein
LSISTEKRICSGNAPSAANAARISPIVLPLSLMSSTNNSRSPSRVRCASTATSSSPNCAIRVE